MRFFYWQTTHTTFSTGEPKPPGWYYTKHSGSAVKHLEKHVPDLRDRLPDWAFDTPEEEEEEEADEEDKTVKQTPSRTTTPTPTDIFDQLPTPDATSSALPQSIFHPPGTPTPKVLGKRPAERLGTSSISQTLMSGGSSTTQNTTPGTGPIVVPATTGANPPAGTNPPAAMAQPRMRYDAEPEEFSGDTDLDYARRFITNCQLHFRINPTFYSTDREQVIYALGKMNKGPAGRWASDFVKPTVTQ